MARQKAGPLYHFTGMGSSHLGSILADGRIRPTESNVSLEALDAGPRVVSLTTDGGTDTDTHTFEVAAKLQARFTVAVDDAEPWLDFMVRHGATPEVIAALTDSGGIDHERWYVTERFVSAAQWLALDLSDGRHFDADEVRHLARSGGARKALALPQTKRVSPYQRPVK